MNDLTVIRFAGRCFSSEDVALMCQAARDYASLGITEIARTVCEWLDWKRPNGRLKNHECHLLLERLQLEGFLTLPPLRRSGRRGPRRVSIDPQTDPPSPIQTTIAELEPLRLTLVEKSDSTLWRQLVQRFHYLGCRVPVGAHLRYFVKSGNGQILARSARQLPHDWRQHYGYTPLLLETLVDAERFRGTCYRAANWIYLGLTTGGSRTDRLHQARPKTSKLIFVLPLHRRAQRLLRIVDPPAVSLEG